MRRGNVMEIVLFNWGVKVTYILQLSTLDDKTIGYQSA